MTWHVSLFLNGARNEDTNSEKNMKKIWKKNEFQNIKKKEKNGTIFNNKLDANKSSLLCNGKKNSF